MSALIDVENLTLQFRTDEGLVTAVDTPEEFASTLIAMLSDQDGTAPCRQDVVSDLQARMSNDALLDYLRAD